MGHVFATMSKSRARTCLLALAATFVLSDGWLLRGAADLMAQDATPSAAAPAGSATRLVGELGGAERLEFEGLHTFTADAVRAGLLNNIDFLADSHAAAPLTDYLQTLRDKVLAGYQAAGFPEAQVNMSFDSEKGKILVKVNEGPRFKEGVMPPSPGPGRSPSNCCGGILRKFHLFWIQPTNPSPSVWKRSEPTRRIRLPTPATLRSGNPAIRRHLPRYPSMSSAMASTKPCKIWGISLPARK